MIRLSWGCVCVFVCVSVCVWWWADRERVISDMAYVYIHVLLQSGDKIMAARGMHGNIGL